MLDYHLRLNKKTVLHMAGGRWVLLFLALCGIALMGYRLINGLGASTHLSDDWPWGFWIYCDLVLSAIGSCGFAVAILSHVFHIEAFRPLARRALFVAFCCYLLVFLILFAEIGRWDNFYWVFISFAWTSPLYEVFICLTLYFLVQLAEVGEVWLERYLPAIHRYTPYVMPFIVLIACVLPFGQEAALGALYLAMPGKLNAIWYSQALPWNCLLSAFAGGLSFIAVEYHLSNRYFREKGDTVLIAAVLRVAAAVFAVNLVVKIVDLSVRGVWPEVFNGSLAGIMFLLEIIVGAVIPVILGASPFIHFKHFQLFAAVAGVSGVLLNRFNFIFIGMANHAEGGYFPSFLEFAMVLGLTALVILIYIFCVENLAVHWRKDHKKTEPVIR